MEKIKKVAFFSAIGIMATSLVACSREGLFKESSLSSIAKLEVAQEDAISTMLEDTYGVSISEEAAEFLDSDYVSMALQNEGFDDYSCKQLANTSMIYLSQRLKEDNPELSGKNVSVDYEDEEPTILFDDVQYQLDDAILKYVEDVSYLQQSHLSDDENLVRAAEDVARDMMKLAVLDVEVSHGKEEVLVKQK
ncbi:MAG TPA: hypothetical protein IAD45_00825 [Candidatus Faecimonas intestinavium]|nr:hypothetical protein [Candidatus Faecimonas intestinavium]